MFSKTVAPTVEYRNLSKRDFALWGVLWLVVFVIYLPAAKAGMVGDFPRWIATMQQLSFKDYINDASLYQLTQLVAYLFHKAFGVNPWAWHLLQVTMHSANCFLLLLICRNILTDSGIKHAAAVALGAALLYCVSPHNGEVIVHEPCYHYLQGMLMALLIVYWVQRFLYTQQYKYAWWSIILYAISIFSLEVFYLTPWFAFSLVVYYRLVLGIDEMVYKKFIRWIFSPLLLIFVVYLIIQRLTADTYLAHSVGFTAGTSFYLSILPKLLFHTLSLGRFFSQAVRLKVYDICADAVFLTVFYLLLLSVIAYMVLRFKTISIRWKATGLFLIWMLLGVSIVVPMSFPDILLSVFDRYVYFMTPFLYVLLVLVVSAATAYVAVAIWAAYLLVNSYACLKINRYWQQSAQIVHKLVERFPDVGDKIVLLLNNPENINGIGMIGSRPESNFKVLYNITHEGRKINTTVYDVASYNILNKESGVHVTVENDSTLKVTLNQWGTWWWFRYAGATDRETAAFKLYMRDPGHWYELVLKKPVNNYILLYETNEQWKQVDMSKIGLNQY